MIAAKVKTNAGSISKAAKNASFKISHLMHLRCCRVSPLARGDQASTRLAAVRRPPESLSDFVTQKQGENHACGR